MDKVPSVQSDSPTVARRRVRMALREARERAQLTQAQLAEEMEWSLSKVIRIENGDVSISPNDLRPVLALLRVNDRRTIAELMADAKIARMRQRVAWHQQSLFRDHLSYGMRLLVEYEADAVEVCYYSALFVPGLLQSPAYAARLGAAAAPEPPERWQALLAARDPRRQTIFGRIPAPGLRVLLDESVFRRGLGGPAVMAEQLRQLAGWAASRVLTLRVSPFREDTVVTANASFELLTLEDDHAVLYREADPRDELVEDAATTSRYREQFDEVWNAAVAEEDTLSFIQSRIEYLEAINGYRRTGAGAQHP